MLCVRRHPNCHPKAFTLIEVVIALAVAGFSVVAILGLFSTGINADTSSSRSTTLANMAMQVTNQLRGNTNWTASVKGVIRAIYGNVAVSGNVFSVYSIGESIKQDPTGVIHVPGERRVHHMVERVDSGMSVSFQPVFTESLNP